MPCGSCGEPLTSDPRFVQWCQACGWNARPGAQEAVKRGDRFQRRLNREAEERLYRRVTGGDARPGLATPGAYALAGVVHLITLAVVVVGVWGLLGSSWILRTVGAIVLAFAWTLRPRLYYPRKYRRRMRVLDRAETPALYGLCDRVAAELRTSAPHRIVVNGAYNASYERIGLRRRVMLTIGLPLWEVLSPAERLALLGHELGHGANGDSRSGMWVGTALTGLGEWYAFFRPSHRRRMRTRRGGGGGLAIIGEMLVMVVFAVFAELTLLLHRTLSRLTALSGRGAEYRADAFGARVAGRDAAHGMLGSLTLGSSVEQVRRSRATAAARRRPKGEPPAPRTDFWDDLRAYVASIPDSERARRLRVSELDDSAVDSSHPPTYLRLRHVAQLPSTAPAITLTDAEIATLNAELAQARKRLVADL